MADWLLLTGAVVAGFAFGALLVVVLLRRPARSTQPVSHQVVAEEFPAARRPPAQAPAPARAVREFDDDSFGVVKDELSPRDRSMVPPLPTNAANVPTEWARRAAGPLEPGRVRGICSGCGTPITVSSRRPIRVACPVCGRTRLLG